MIVLDTISSCDWSHRPIIQSICVHTETVKSVKPCVSFMSSASCCLAFISRFISNLIFFIGGFPSVCAPV